MRLYGRSPMFWKKEREPSVIDLMIEGAARGAMKCEVGSEEYHKLTDKVIKLTELKNAAHSKDSVDKNTMVSVGANLLGILMIIRHEFSNPITSKALSFVIRPKI
jgi:hypothetical protein